MATITNVSSVADNSGETPIVTPSNPVTTVINDAPQPCKCRCRRFCYCCRCPYCGRCRCCCYRCCCYRCDNDYD